MADSFQHSYPCTECQAGVMHVRYITYFTWLDEELVSVPNFPAWMCDLCRRREYDQRAIAWLTTILNPDTGKPAASPPHLHPPQDKKRASIHISLI